MTTKNYKQLARQIQVLTIKPKSVSGSQMTPSMSKKRLLSFTIVILTIYLIVNLGRNIWRLSQAGGRITDVETRLKQIAKEQYELRQKLAAVTSQDYQEKQIREKLHLVQPGEKIILLPEDMAILPSPTLTPVPLENWEKWWERLIKN